MKTLWQPQPCKVLLHKHQIEAVHFRERAWVVREVNEVYSLTDPWRTLPNLAGEKRIYHRLHTTFGEILIFERIRGQNPGWFVAGWWD